MFTSPISGFFYRLAEWMTRLAYINILWLGFSIGGLLLFSFFPATVAMFSVIRKWTIHHTDAPIFATFWQAFRQDYVKSQKLGLLLVLCGLILYVDIQLLLPYDAGFGKGLYYLILGISVVAILCCFYLFPTFVHYHLSMKDTFKHAFFTMVLHPLKTVTMASITVCFLFIGTYLPGLFLLYGGSFLALAYMYLAHTTFEKLEASALE